MGLARSAYISSESALRTELLLEEALETEETLLTLSDLDFRDFLDPAGDGVAVDEWERDLEPDRDPERELEPL